MKALIYYGPKDIKLEEVPMPEAGSKDVLVKIERAGICGSDLTAYLYDGMGVGILRKGQFGHDGQFGHEMVGTVSQLGSEVEGIEVGDRVFINPTVCKRNGMLGCDVAGAFSEYTVVEDAKYGYNLYKLDDDCSFDEAVVIESLGVGTHGKNRIQVRPSDKVLIYGAGTIGLCALNACLAVGCQDVVVSDMNAQRLEMVKEMGGIPFNSAVDGDLKEFLMNLHGPVYDTFGQAKTAIDAFIDCAGAAPILPEIVSLAKAKSRVAIVAVYKRPAELNAVGLLSNEMTVKGCCGYETEDIVEAFNNVNKHRTEIPKIVTHHFKHEDAVKAFEFAAYPAAGGIKVVIDYE